MSQNTDRSSQDRTRTETAPTDVKPPRPAKTPVGPGVITTVGLVLALCVVGLGVVGVQAALVAAGLLSGTSWLGSTLDRAQSVSPAAWMLPVGVLLALVGLWLVFASLKPRPRNAVALQAETGVFMRPRALARLAEAAAAEVDGVQSARASATRSKVKVRAETAGGSDVADAVQAAVIRRLQPLEKTPRVAVTIEGEGS